MSKKEILVPFDLAAAKAGAKIKTLSGCDARIICYDLIGNGASKIVALVLVKADNSCREEMYTFNKRGQWMDDKTSSLDLRIVEEMDEQERWIDRMGGKTLGWCLAYNGKVIKAYSNGKEKNYWKSIFAEKKQAQAAAAAAQISQIMANDERFGGVVTAEEWNKESVTKYVICREKDEIRYVTELITFVLLAFHTAAQRALFFDENRDLVLKYYML